MDLSQLPGPKPEDGKEGDISGTDEEGAGASEESFEVMDGDKLEVEETVPEKIDEPVANDSIEKVIEKNKEEEFAEEEVNGVESETEDVKESRS